MNKPEEVLVVNRKNLEFVPRIVLDESECFFNVKPQELFTLLKGVSYKIREYVENDENYVQLIPYVTLTDAGKFLAYNRGSKGGESRLANKWSIGVGGHVNPCDGCLFEKPSWSILVEAAKRELKEEINLDLQDGHIATSFRGLIYDPSNSVGRVHLGFHFEIELLDPTVVKTIPGELEWKTVEELNKLNLETWSRIVL